MDDKTGQGKVGSSEVKLEMWGAEVERTQEEKSRPAKGSLQGGERKRGWTTAGPRFSRSPKKTTLRPVAVRK